MPPPSKIFGGAAPFPSPFNRPLPVKASREADTHRSALRLVDHIQVLEGTEASAAAVHYLEHVAHELRFRSMRAPASTPVVVLPAVTAVRLCIAETRQQIVEVRRQVAEVRARITGRVALFGAADVARVDRFTADIERTNRGTDGHAA